MRSLRRIFAGGVLAACVAVSGGYALAGNWVAGELPAEFSNDGDSAFVSEDPRRFNSLQVISKESAKLTQRVAKCYESAARNHNAGRPTLLVGCLANARQKYSLKLAKIEVKAPGLPGCHDYATEPDLAEAWVLESMPDLLCASPGGAFLDRGALY